jgi:hypothetical protein
MGNNQLAIYDFNSAISFDDTKSDGYYYRGLSRTLMKRFKPAIKDFEDAKVREK